jgi:hypothetical protein
MDELQAVAQVLAEPPPAPEVVEAAQGRLERAALGGTSLPARGVGQPWQAPDPVRRSAPPRRRPGWLAPAAAAAAVVAVTFASLGISGAIGHGASSTGPAAPGGVLAKLPRYFVAMPETVGGRAVVGATATGDVLGTVAPPRAYPIFRSVTSAADDRTFVVAVGTHTLGGTVTFYRLALDRSGHPGRLAPLPIPPAHPGADLGMALSPDGSKLAVSVPPAHGQRGSRLEVFSLASGAHRQWVWPGRGTVSVGAYGGANSWEADGQALLFEVTTQTKTGWPGQLRLLDTAASAGSLRASSKPIPLPAGDVGWQSNNVTHRIIGIPAITGDGSALITSFFHLSARPKMFGFTITEFSVRTGKPGAVLFQRRSATEAGSSTVWWVNATGTAVIASHGSVFGVQTPSTFTPLPPGVQQLFDQGGQFIRKPTW